MLVTYFGSYLCYRLSHRGGTSTSGPVDCMYVTGHAYVVVSSPVSCLSGAKDDRSASRDGQQDTVKYCGVFSGRQTDERRVSVSTCRRCKRCGYCSSDLLDFEKLLDESDDQLFCKILNNSTHTLHTLLPPQSIASQTKHKPVT